MKHHRWIMEDESQKPREAENRNHAFSIGVDVFRLDRCYHNGPECVACGTLRCHYCYPGIYREECRG